MRRNTFLSALLIMLSYAVSAQNYMTVSTFAGTSVSGLSDGPLASAQFNHPYGVCSDGQDNIYVADTYNNCIRKIHNGMVSTIAGNGTSGDVDASGTSARFNHPTGVYYKNYYLYICDNLNNKIKRMDTSGNVVTIAGSGLWTYQDGPVNQAAFKEPKSLVVDNNNVVYVADYENHCIRKIANGQVTTYAGVGGTAGDQTGPASSALFYRPRDLCIDAMGNLYVVDLMNNKVKMISTTGTVSLVAGSGAQGNADGTGASATFDRPVAIDWLPSGDLCVLSAVSPMLRCVTTSGVVTTIAGTGTSGYFDGATNSAMFNLPQDICFTSNGDLYVGDDNNNVVRILTNINAKGIEERSAGQLNFYPNPATNNIFIDNSAADPISSLTIMTVDGKIMKKMEKVADTEQVKLDISDLPKGAYILYAITRKDALLTSRLILQ